VLYKKWMLCTLLMLRCFVATVAVQAPDDEPVWRQLVRLHVNHSNPEAAQQAAAALAE
jgi:hypothetical protein